MSKVTKTTLIGLAAAAIAAPLAQADAYRSHDATRPHDAYRLRDAMGPRDAYGVRDAYRPRDAYDVGRLHKMLPWKNGLRQLGY
jgi:hypothetical protein